MAENCPTCFRPFPKKKSKAFRKPTPQEVTDYGREIGFFVDGKHFCNYYESKGWVIGKAPMKSWKAAVRVWKGLATPDKLFSTDSTPEAKQEKLAAKEKELEEMKERLYRERTGAV